MSSSDDDDSQDPVTYMLRVAKKKTSAQNSAMNSSIDTTSELPVTSPPPAAPPANETLSIEKHSVSDKKGDEHSEPTQNSVAEDARFMIENEPTEKMFGTIEETIVLDSYQAFEPACGNGSDGEKETGAPIPLHNKKNDGQDKEEDLIPKVASSSGSGGPTTAGTSPSPQLPNFVPFARKGSSSMRRRLSMASRNPFDVKKRMSVDGSTGSAGSHAGSVGMQRRCSSVAECHSNNGSLSRARDSSGDGSSVRNSYSKDGETWKEQSLNNETEREAAHFEKASEPSSDQESGIDESDDIMIKYLKSGGEIETFESHVKLQFGAPRDHQSKDGASLAEESVGAANSSPSFVSDQLGSLIKFRSTAAKHIAKLKMVTTPEKEYSICCELDLDHDDWRQRSAYVTVYKLTPPDNKSLLQRAIRTASMIPGMGNSQDDLTSSNSASNSNFMASASSSHLHHQREVLMRRNMKDIEAFRRFAVGSTDASYADDSTARVTFTQLPVTFNSWCLHQLKSEKNIMAAAGAGGSGSSNAAASKLPQYHPPYSCQGDVGLLITFSPPKSLDCPSNGPRYQKFPNLTIKFTTCEDRERWYAALQAVQSSLMQDALREDTEGDDEKPPVVDLFRTRPNAAEVAKQVTQFLDFQEEVEEETVGDNQKLKKKPSGGILQKKNSAGEGLNNDGLPKPPNKGLVDFAFPNKNKPRKVIAKKNKDGLVVVQVLPATAGQMWRGVPEHSLLVTNLDVVAPSAGWGTSFFLERRDPETHKRQRLELIAKSFEDRTKWIKWFDEVKGNLSQEEKESEEAAKRAEEERLEKEKELGRLAYKSFSAATGPPTYEKKAAPSIEAGKETSSSAPVDELLSPKRKVAFEDEAPIKAGAESTPRAGGTSPSLSSSLEGPPTSTTANSKSTKLRRKTTAATEAVSTTAGTKRFYDPSSIWKEPEDLSSSEDLDETEKGVKATRSKGEKPQQLHEDLFQDWVLVSHSSLSNPVYCLLKLYKNKGEEDAETQQDSNGDGDEECVLDLNLNIKNIAKCVPFPKRHKSTAAASSAAPFTASMFSSFPPTFSSSWSCAVYLKPFPTTDELAPNEQSQKGSSLLLSSTDLQDAIYLSKLLQEPLVVSCTNPAAAARMQACFGTALGSSGNAGSATGSGGHAEEKSPLKSSLKTHQKQNDDEIVKKLATDNSL